MKRIKKCLAVVLTVVTCFALSISFGCGGGKSEGHLDGKYNLEIAVQNENGEIKMMEIWKKAYEEKHPEVNIIINNFGNDDIVGRNHANGEVIGNQRLEEIFSHDDRSRCLRSVVIKIDNDNRIFMD